MKKPKKPIWKATEDERIIGADSDRKLLNPANRPRKKKAAVTKKSSIEKPSGK